MATLGDAEPPPHAAMCKIDNPMNPDQFAAIRTAVDRGFLVRARAHTKSKPRNEPRFDAMRSSGAQLITFEADIRSNWCHFLDRLGWPAKQRCDAKGIRPNVCAIANGTTINCDVV